MHAWCPSSSATAGYKSELMTPLESAKVMSVTVTSIISSRKFQTQFSFCSLLFSAGGPSHSAHRVVNAAPMAAVCSACSGLDSTTALQLVESLRALASGGRAIITTIHQPSSRLYQLLDKLMLLCDGHVMYYGKVLIVIALASRFEVPVVRVA